MSGHLLQCGSSSGLFDVIGPLFGCAYLHCVCVLGARRPPCICVAPRIVCLKKARSVGVARACDVPPRTCSTSSATPPFRLPPARTAPSTTSWSVAIVCRMSLRRPHLSCLRVLVGVPELSSIYMWVSGFVPGVPPPLGDRPEGGTARSAHNVVWRTRTDGVVLRMLKRGSTERGFL